jgi:hypothetical protein
MELVKALSRLKVNAPTVPPQSKANCAGVIAETPTK